MQWIELFLRKMQLPGTEGSGTTLQEDDVMKTASPESPNEYNLGFQEPKTDTLISTFRVMHKWKGWTAFLQAKAETYYYLGSPTPTQG